MRARTWIVGAAAMAAMSAGVAAQAGMIAYDGFETPGMYTVGDLPGQNPAITGWTGAWKNGDNAANSDARSGSGLTYSIAGDPLAATDGDFFQKDNARAVRQLSTGYGSSFSGTVYLSFLLQDLTAGGVNWGFEAHDAGTNNPTYNGTRKLQIGYDGGAGGGAGNYMVRVNNSNSFAAGLGALDTAVNLFVVRFNFSTTINGDSLTIWRNPTSLTEPLVGGVTVSGFNLAFDNIGAGHYNNAGGAVIDEFRLGQSYEDVVASAAPPIPEPATLGLGILGLGMVTMLRRRR